MKEKPADNTYEYYYYVARAFAENGNRESARMIMEMMMEKWPERVIAKSAELDNSQVLNKKLER